MFKKIGSFIQRWLIGATAAAAETPPQKSSGDRRRKNRNPKKSMPVLPTPKPEIERPAASEAKKPRRKRRSPSENRPEGNAAEVPEMSLGELAVPEMPETLKEVPAAEGKTRFLDLDLPRAVQFGLQDLDFSYCTPIQAAAFPELLKGRDVCGKAQTGTGKTAAFLVAIFKKLMEEPADGFKPGECRALVMAPTRELAIQIHKDAENIGKYAGLHNVVVFGGMDHQKQQRELNRPIDILIGTPGRIIDFSRSGSLNLRRAKMLVIDEADRMLDMGFIPDVRRIVSMLPHREERQTMLFSATLEDSILRLASSFLNNPEMLESEPEEIVCHNINQLFYTVSRHEKLPLLVNLLHKHSEERIMIFGNRKCDNLDLQNNLGKYGIHAVLLSGDIAQEKRLKILEAFRSGREKVLIATDVAARGIHVDDVSLVINYDLPDRPEDYVHRVGRTGRAGHTGTSLGLLDEYGAYALPAIEDMLGVKFSSVMPDDDMLVLPPPDPSYRPAPAQRSERSFGARRGGSGPRRRR